MDNRLFDVMRAVIENERNAEEALLGVLDGQQYLKALDLLVHSPMTVTTACGSSGFAAQKFAHALCCVEKPAKFVPPGEAVHGGMGALKKDAALLVISRGGKSDELIPIVEIAKKKEATVIVITAVPDSPLGQAADAMLLLPDVPESDKFGVMSTSSFVTTMSVLNALMVGIMEATDYKLEDFALIHPGGAVGKRIT